MVQNTELILGRCFETTMMADSTHIGPSCMRHTLSGELNMHLVCALLFAYAGGLRNL